MIYKKKSLKPGIDRLVLVLFHIIAIIWLDTVSARAQSSDSKTHTWISRTSDTEDNTVVISQIISDSRNNDSPGSSKGMQTMFTYLKKSINYPSKAIEAKIQGDVMVAFTVTKEGKVINNRIIKGIHPDLDNEVIRAVKEMPIWNVTEKDKQKANVDYKITMAFALPDNDSVKEPTVSVWGIETGELKVSLKKENDIKYGTLTISVSPDAKKDTISTKTVTVITKDSDNKMNVTVEEDSK